MRVWIFELRRVASIHYALYTVIYTHIGRNAYFIVYERTTQVGHLIDNNQLLYIIEHVFLLIQPAHIYATEMYVVVVVVGEIYTT